MWAVDSIARLLPLPTPMASAWLGLAAVPLLGSLITEPAAMTIAALMLAPQIFRPQLTEPLKYLALGVLFVNVSDLSAKPGLSNATPAGFRGAFAITVKPPPATAPATSMYLVSSELPEVSDPR